jgi:hypothetical protein
MLQKRLAGPIPCGRFRRFYGHNPGQPLDRPGLTFSCTSRS